MEKQVTLNNLTPEIAPEKPPKELSDLSLLPEGWKWVRLERIMDLTNGKGITKRDMTPDGIYLVYGSNGVIGKSNNFLIEKDTIVIGRVGACGAINVARAPVWISDNAMYVSELSDEIDLFFLYFALKQLNLSQLAKIVAQPSISQEPIKRQLIPLPPLKTQKRIVARIEEILSRVEKAKKLREETLKDTESIMRSTLHEVFSKAEEKGEEWGRIDDPDTAELIMGQSPPSSTYNENGNGLPFFQGKADFGLVYPTPRKWCDTPQKIALPNDVLISVRAPTGPVNICKEKCCIGRGLAAIRAREKLYYKFLFYFLRYLEPEMAVKGKGSTFGAITKKRLESLKIPLPPVEEQKRIVAYLDKLQEKVEALRKHQEKTKKEIEAITVSVLDKAFRGELVA